MKRIWFLAAAAALTATQTFADDWVAVKLRGRVLQLVGSEWQQLKRGDIVSDDRVIRTLRDGRVSFQRAAETIDLGGDTQIQIHDRNGKRFTTVQQYFGEVAVEAEVRQVQHFAVQTPELVAVVKGTRFIVTSDGKSAEVKVKRGHVAVEDRDTHQTTTVAARQSVSTSNGNAPLVVSGLGKLPPVYAANGTPVTVVGNGQDSPKEAAKAAYAAALDAGFSKKEAQKAAKQAERDAKDAGKAAEKAAGASAYAAAIASGASPKEAEKAAKSAEKETKEESKASEKAAKEESKSAEQQSKSEEKASKHESKSDSGSASSSSSESGSSAGGGGSGSGEGGGSGGGGDSGGSGDSGGGGGKGHGKDK